MPKLKIHHRAGITRFMKNLFGLIPGAVWGGGQKYTALFGNRWSHSGYQLSVDPYFAITDGIIGVEGDGPIMGADKISDVVVMGRNLPAVNAACIRIIGINPLKILYLRKTFGWLGIIWENNLKQVGEPIEKLQTTFALAERIPAHRDIYF